MGKKLSSLILLLVICSGCSVITITSPEDGKVFKYRRLGTQAIRGFELIRTPDGGFVVKFGSLKSDSGKLGEAAADAARSAATLIVH